VPELIFGQLLTSSNYDDKQQKVTGGRNGFGAKLANIFSTEFILETADSESGKDYRQVFSKNMSVQGAPTITAQTKARDHTCVTFKPDLTKFGMDSLDADTVSLMAKRVYDLAGVTDKRVKVKLNGKLIVCKDFSSYCDLYLKNVEHRELPKIEEVKNRSERWEVVCSLSDGQFNQVSFVNAICTTKGGTHVEYIANQIVSEIVKAVAKKNKKVAVKPHQVKANLWLFINCLVENPAFDS